MVFKLFEDIYLMINNKVIWYRLKKECECKIISEKVVSGYVKLISIELYEL